MPGGIIPMTFTTHFGFRLPLWFGLRIDMLTC
jgi:hypothetical protein